MLNVLPVLLALSSATFQEPTGASAARVLEARTTAVTVFPDRALVTRVATAGAGEWVFRGLPLGTDRSSLRVRARGGDVVAIEARERVDQSVLDARLEELRAELADLRRERESLTDERSSADDLKGHLQGLLLLEQEGPVPTGARSGPEDWSAHLEFTRQRLRVARAELRGIAWRIEDIDARVEELETDLGRSFRPEVVQSLDVVVDIVARVAGPVELELESLVSGAGWRPRYDLRARADARAVEFTYRAEVWQTTGEDWNEIELALSTARPSLGAEGPEPEPRWVRLIHPQRRGAVASAPAAAAMPDAESSAQVERASDALHFRFASVESQGLSVRFRLPRNESVRTGGDATTVLVGEASLATRPEYVAVPALDPHVWLRGIATNTSPWVWLPGQASVFFGADFVGHAQLDAVQPGGELTLHLGADPGLAIERLQLEDSARGPGAFSSRSSHTETWRMRLTNHGAAAAAGDGSVRVLVREAVPRSTDSRLSVELSKVTPPPSRDERWKRDLEERGVHTWELSVPRGGEAEVGYRLKVSYPSGSRIER